MTVQQAIVTLIAAVISGVLATIITLCINSYNEKIRQKQRLLDDIFSFKYQLTGEQKSLSVDIYSQGFCRAMNRVPIIFNKNEKVLNAYDKLYDTLYISDKREKQVKSDEALIVLLKEMCKVAHIKCDNWNDSKFIRTFTVNS